MNSGSSVFNCFFWLRTENARTFGKYPTSVPVMPSFILRKIKKLNLFMKTLKACLCLSKRHFSKQKQIGHMYS